ncbi:MAG: glucosamine-6-phosphate deaminase [Rhodothermales bacterium]
MLVEVFDDYDAMSERAAELVTEQIRRKPDSVIGFATGGTPLGMYERLIKNHHERGLDFSKITTFNLDEYIGLPPTHPQSYHHFMWEHLFDHINVNPSQVYVPHGMADDVESFCAWYERQIAEAGGIDLQILGIGANGHLAFNEPGSSLGSRTRIKTLTEKTVRDNARFFDEGETVPHQAITMGIGTIMDAETVLLVASGEHKAEAIRSALEGPVTGMCPATVVQMHRFAHILLDEQAASRLEYRHHGGIAEPKS